MLHRQHRTQEWETLCCCETKPSTLSARHEMLFPEAGGVKVAVRAQQVFCVLADAESGYHIHCSCTEHEPGVYVWVAKAVSRRKRALGPKILLRSHAAPLICETRCYVLGTFTVWTQRVVTYQDQ